MTCDCECPSGTHESRCELATMPLTKVEFVNTAEVSARAALESYKLLISMDFIDKDVCEMAIEEARESATCFAGIGSCDGGGCKHA